MNTQIEMKLRKLNAFWLCFTNKKPLPKEYHSMHATTFVQFSGLYYLFVDVLLYAVRKASVCILCFYVCTDYWFMHVCTRWNERERGEYRKKNSALG